MVAKQWLFFAALTVASTFVVLPAAIGFPTTVGQPGKQSDITILIWGLVVAFDISVLAIASNKSGAARAGILRAIAALAAISLAASGLLAADVHIPFIKIPSPHILAPLLHVDGQFAYDADVFEIYCELWLFVALMFGVVSYCYRLVTAQRFTLT